MFFKKACALLLACALLVPSLAFAEEIPAYQAGDTVDLVFTVTENPNKAIGATLRLDYNHDAFELIPSVSVQNDAPIINLNMNGIPVGETVAASFRVLPEAAGGAYWFEINVVQAANVNEDEVDGLSFSSCQVQVTDLRTALDQANAEIEALRKQLEEALKALEEERANPGASSTADFQYKIENGLATITKYVGSGGDVVIPGNLGGYTVASIGSAAFQRCESLRSVAIPDSVTSIKENAFNSCGNLNSVNIPNSVTSIGVAAFSVCGSLQSIVIPDSVKSIGNYAFQRCSSLTEITLSNSLTAIGDSVFFGCESLTAISIPDSVKTIDSYAFYGCGSLTEVSIPDSVMSIGFAAFKDCGSLTEITVPDQVTSIGSSVFFGCGSLKVVTLPSHVKSIGENAFSACSESLVVYVAKGSYAYRYCKDHNLKYKIK